MSDTSDLEKFFPLQEVELADPNERQRRMSRKQHNPYDFTDDEKKYLRSSSHIHPEIKSSLPRNLDAVGIHTMAHRKLTAAYKAEADALEALRRRQTLNGEITDAADALQKLSASERNERQAAQIIDDQRREIERLKTLPSMAVFSED